MFILCLLLFIPVELQFISIKNREFIRDSKPYYFLGTNFWYGMNLAAENPKRLIRELENLHSLGITNLRIMGSSQGPNSEPYRMLDALEIDKEGNLDTHILEGLDLLLAVMGELNMTAVIPLNNFWHWSGGFPQYVHWHCNDKPIPYPVRGKPWDDLTDYIKGFYTCTKAVEQYKNFYKQLANRINSKTNVAYKNDPTIMAWQLANEPWPVDLKETYTKWVEKMIGFIKSEDKNHLVSVGIEGLSSDSDYEKNSQWADYLTCHVWAQNWGWYNPKDRRTYEYGKKKAQEYINNHKAILKRVKKPFVLEEFGLARDDETYESHTSTTYKDDYYAMIFEIVYSMASDGLASGVNFWAWAGEGRPKNPGGMWKKGDPWTGDPPHEPQGWYSVYNTDRTIDVIKDYAKKFNELTKDESSTESNTIIIVGIVCAFVIVIALLVVVICFGCRNTCDKCIGDDTKLMV
jgi:mannan endo-1,4-beta-mannosidase